MKTVLIHEASQSTEYMHGNAESFYFCHALSYALSQAHAFVYDCE